MQLSVTLGSPEASKVVLRLISHSATNGAPFTTGATFVIGNNNPAVATAADIPPLAGGEQSVDTPVTVLAAGSTDFHCVETAPDGTIFEDTATLTVLPQPEAGQVRMEVQLVVTP